MRINGYTDKIILLIFNNECIFNDLGGFQVSETGLNVECVNSQPHTRDNDSIQIKFSTWLSPDCTFYRLAMREIENGWATIAGNAARPVAHCEFVVCENWPLARFLHYRKPTQRFVEIYNRTMNFYSSDH